MTGFRLLLSDVHGTLVRPDKSLSPRSIAAVHALRDAGILFAVTSGRPRAACRCWSSRDDRFTNAVERFVLGST